MDLAATSAGPWLLLGVVLGVLLAGVLALAAASLRRGPRPGARASGAAPDSPPVPVPATGWVEDDLPGFLERPPGSPPDEPVRSAIATRPSTAALADGSVPFAEPARAASTVRRTVPAHAAPAPGGPDGRRLLLVLVTGAVLLVGAAAALAALTDPTSTAVATATAPTGPMRATDTPPTWVVPDLAAVPEQPERGDPGAGRLAATSVPTGPDGVFARLSFEGLVLERRAVGVTAAYPSISLTAADLGAGPALAHVRLPVWNCLTDTAPADPISAGCRRLPTEYADLPSPALTVTEDGEGLRIRGSFPTYVRPNGSSPEWTGQVYPLAVHVVPDGDSATGTLHLGTARTGAVDDPRLSDFRRGS